MGRSVRTREQIEASITRSLESARDYEKRGARAEDSLEATECYQLAEMHLRWAGEDEDELWHRFGDELVDESAVSL